MTSFFNLSKKLNTHQWTLPWILSGYCFGIYLAWFGKPLNIAFIVIPIALMIATKSYKNYSCALLALLIGFLYTDHRLIPYTEIPNSIKIIDEPLAINNRTIKCLARPLPHGPKIRIYAPHHPDIAYGAHLSITGKVIPAKPPTNPGQFDYPSYLKQHNIKQIIRVTDVTLIKQSIGNPVKRIAYKLKQAILILHQTTLPQPYSDLLTGLVFGQHGTQLPKDISDAFQRTGLTHLLVVSGSQVALISGIVFNGLTTIGISLKRRVIIICSVNCIFYFVTGGGAAIFRAITMMMTTLGLKVLKRKTSSFHILGTTALMMLILNPLDLFNAGAQLSFLATAALIFVAPTIQDKLPKNWPKWITTLVSVTIAPFLLTTPLLGFAFNQISVISLFSNLIMGTWIELLVVTGFFSTIVGLLIKPIAQLINYGCWIAMVGLTHCVEWMSGIPGGVIAIKTPSPLFIAGIYGLIALFSLGGHYVNRTSKKKLTIALIIILGASFPGFTSSNVLKLCVFDVGQGDSILIITPSKKTILIDAGNARYDRKTQSFTNDSGRQIIGPALNYFGINKIDLAIITHHHLDHVGGFPYIFKNYQVGTIIHNQNFKKAYQQYLNPKKEFNRSTSWTYEFKDGVTLHILYPPHISENENNNSLAIKLTYKKASFLFTGDLEKEGEAHLINRYPDLLAATILKLGHHGSKTSSTNDFLNKVRPKIAIVSAGRHNRYKHPHPSVLKRCRYKGIDIIRTDHHGAIQMSTDGNQIKIDKKM